MRKSVKEHHIESIRRPEKHWAKTKHNGTKQGNERGISQMSEEKARLREWQVRLKRTEEQSEPTRRDGRSEQNAQK